jgi:hypothetical protein
MKLSWINSSTKGIEIIGANHALIVEAYGPAIHELAANCPASGV